jgi:hypothetical protein
VFAVSRRDSASTIGAPRTATAPSLPGIGDFTERIRAGRVLPSGPDPVTADIPEELQPFCRSLGYL